MMPSLPQHQLCIHSTSIYWMPTTCLLCAPGDTLASQKRYLDPALKDSRQLMTECIGKINSNIHDIEALYVWA